MKFFSLIALVLAFISCTNDIDLGQPDYESKIVVDGYIENGQYAHIYLTMSSPFLTHYDSASIAATFLNYAKITLSSSKGQEEVLTIFKGDASFPPFVYRSISIKGEVGVRYDIKVETGGKTATATTTIPQPPVVSDAGYRVMSDSTGIPAYTVLSSDRQPIYLFPRVRSALANENYHPSQYGCVKIDPGEGLVLHKLYRVREIRVYLFDSNNSYYNSSYPEYEYALNDTISLIPGAVDSISYRVIKSFFEDVEALEDPFSFNGSSMETNIEGGIGRWTGIGISRPITIVSRPAEF
ncbi:DUF4249 family protein [Geofilum sp. OHC36d9]|uniref:DUF4249 family protein n=1 Tax=Geofilum sp. OHC36d9 TaxID=3458413 RepID=UPI004033495F